MNSLLLASLLILLVIWNPTDKIDIPLLRNPVILGSLLVVNLIMFYHSRTIAILMLIVNMLLINHAYNSRWTKHTNNYIVKILEMKI